MEDYHPQEFDACDLSHLTPRQRKQYKYARSLKGRIAKARYEATDKGIASRNACQRRYRHKTERDATAYNARRRLERRQKYNATYHPELAGTPAFDYYPEEVVPDVPPPPAPIVLRKFGWMPPPTCPDLNIAVLE